MMVGYARRHSPVAKPCVQVELRELKDELARLMEVKTGSAGF